MYAATGNADDPRTFLLYLRLNAGPGSRRPSPWRSPADRHSPHEGQVLAFILYNGTDRNEMAPKVMFLALLSDFKKVLTRSS